jgi:carbonic anhydrase
VPSDKDIRPLSSPISIDYDRRMTGRFEHLGTTLEFTPSSRLERNYSITLGDRRYDLVQFHLHTPSEHHIDGEYFPMELHLVHQSTDDEPKLLVLGIPFDATRFPVSSGHTLSKLASYTPALREKGDHADVRELGLTTDIMDRVDMSAIATYPGSLTTPPCSEGVTWLVHRKAMEVDARALRGFKRVVGYNARDLQEVFDGEDDEQSGSYGKNKAGEDQ